MDNERGFLAQEESSSKLTRYLIGFGVAIFVAFFVKPYFRTFFHPQWTVERAQAEMESDPQMGAVYVALRDNYPADARRLAEQAAADANANDEAAAQRDAFQFMRHFVQGKLPAITAAPADLLHQIGREYSAMMHVLKNSDANLCGRLVMAGFQPGDQPPPFAAEHLARIAALQIRAARAGEAGGRAARGALSESDRTAFAAALRANDPSVAALLGDQAALRAAPPERQCATGTAIYDAAAELPDESAANVMAQIIRDSLSD